MNLYPNPLNRYTKRGRILSRIITKETNCNGYSETLCKIDKYKEICDNWYTRMNQEATDFHIDAQMKDPSFLTEANIQHFMDHSKGQTYLGVGDNEAHYLCNELMENEDFKPNQLANSKLKNCQKQLNFQKQFVKDEKYKLDLCVTELNEVKQYRYNENNHARTFRKGVETLLNQCVDALETHSTNQAYSELKQQKVLNDKYAQYTADQAIKQENITKSLHQFKYNYNHCQAVLNRVNEKLSIAKQVLTECKEAKYWYWRLSKIGKIIGFMLEFVLELTVWPYAAFNEDSLFYKLLPKLPNAISRLILTICLSLLWGLTIIQLQKSLVFRHERTELELELLEKSKNQKERSNTHSKIRQPKPLPSFLDVQRGGFVDLSIDPQLQQCLIEVKLASIRNKILEIKSLIENESPNYPNRSLYHVKLFTAIVFSNIRHMNSSPGIKMYELPKSQTIAINERVLPSQHIILPNIEIDEVNLNHTFTDIDTGLNIFLPGENLVLKEFNLNLRNNQEDLKPGMKKSTYARFKNYQRKTKPQVGRFSDFLQETNESLVENDFIQQSKVQEKMKIRIDE